MDRAEFMQMIEKKGEVPPVDAADLKAVWKLTREVTSSFKGQQVAVAMKAYRSVGHHEADAHVVWYRATMLGLLSMLAGPMKLSWMCGDELDEVVFRVMAGFPALVTALTRGSEKCLKHERLLSFRNPSLLKDS